MGSYPTPRFQGECTAFSLWVKSFQTIRLDWKPRIVASVADEARWTPSTGYVMLQVVTVRMIWLTCLCIMNR